jgi:hypothetical protein
VAASNQLSATTGSSEGASAATIRIEAFRIRSKRSPDSGAKMVSLCMPASPREISELGTVSGLLQPRLALATPAGLDNWVAVSFLSSRSLDGLLCSVCNSLPNTQAEHAHETSE